MEDCQGLRCCYSNPNFDEACRGVGIQARDKRDR